MSYYLIDKATGDMEDIYANRSENMGDMGCYLNTNVRHLLTEMSDRSLGRPLGIGIASMPTGGMGDLVFGIKFAEFILSYYDSEQLLQPGQTRDPVHIYFITSWDNGAHPRDPVTREILPLTTAADYMDRNPARFVRESIGPENFDAYYVPGYYIPRTAGAKITFIFLDTQDAVTRGIYPDTAPPFDIDVLFVAPGTGWRSIQLGVNNFNNLRFNSYIMSEYNPQFGQAQGVDPRGISIATGVGMTDVATGGIQGTAVGLMVENKTAFDPQMQGIPVNVLQSMNPLLPTGTDQIPLYSICYMYLMAQSNFPGGLPDSIVAKYDFLPTDTLSELYQMLRICQCMVQYLANVYEYATRNYPGQYIMRGGQKIDLPIYILMRANTLAAEPTVSEGTWNSILEVIEIMMPDEYEAAGLDMIRSFLDDELPGLQKVAMPPVKHRDMLRVYQHSLPVVFISGDQSITDYLSVRKDFRTSIFYHVFYWKNALAINLGIDLTQTPVCGMVTVDILNNIADSALMYFKFGGMFVVNALLAKAYKTATDQQLGCSMDVQDWKYGEMAGFFQEYNQDISVMRQSVEGLGEHFIDLRGNEIVFDVKNINHSWFGPVYPLDAGAGGGSKFLTSFLHRYARKNEAGVFIKYINVDGSCLRGDNLAVCDGTIAVDEQPRQNYHYNMIVPDKGGVENLASLDINTDMMKYAVVNWWGDQTLIITENVRVLPEGVNTLLVNQLINLMKQEMKNLVKTYASFVEYTENMQDLLPGQRGGLGAYLIQEFVPGARNFREFVKDSGSNVTIMDFFEIFFQILAILSYIQCNFEMVHNDFWGGNIMIEELNSPVLFDCYVLNIPGDVVNYGGFAMRFYSRWRVRVIDFDNASYTLLDTRYSSVISFVHKSPTYLQLFDLTYLILDLISGIENERGASRDQLKILDMLRNMLGILVPAVEGSSLNNSRLLESFNDPVLPLNFVQNNPDRFNQLVNYLFSEVWENGVDYAITHTDYIDDILPSTPCQGTIWENNAPEDYIRLPNGDTVDLGIPEYRVK